jgi:hypothetical protein
MTDLFNLFIFHDADLFSSLFIFPDVISSLVFFQDADQ